MINIATGTANIAVDGSGMLQIARNMTDPFDGFLTGKTHLIHDRDTKYCTAFCEVLGDVGSAVKNARAAGIMRAGRCRSIGPVITSGS